MASKKVLYIDDDLEMLGLMRLILESRGFQALTAGGGNDGLALIRQEHPDLILLDLMMPDLDGWQVYSQVRHNQQSKNIPIILITAVADNIDLLTKRDFPDIVAYFTKPFETAKLVKTIKRALEIH